MKKLLTRVNDTQKNEKGFTLIELIVVIAIIGILALIVVPRLGAFQENARQSGDQQVAAVYANATLALIAKYPDITGIDSNGTIAGGGAAVPTKGTLEAALIADDLLVAGDLTLRSKAFKNPATGSNLSLTYDGTSVVVTLKSNTPSKTKDYILTK